MTRRIVGDLEVRQYAEGAEDAHGNPTDGWGDPVAVPYWVFDPGSTSEPRDGNDRVIVEPTAYFPPGPVTIGPRDRVDHDGETYEAEGVTRAWRNTRGEYLGNVITLRRVDG